jgi:tetratricopeptide (TPR) repeat protein
LDEALQVARQIADALHAANALGIVHRDMKPANIMLVPVETSAPHGFRAVITDFGLARIDAVVSSGARSALSHTTRPIGTLAYMAPEQLDGSTVSPATDLYAFGLVLFEMVTGRRAFPSDNFLSGIAQRLTGSPPSPLALVPNLPHPWCRAIEGCLRLKPADRFQSAADIIDVLDGSYTNLPSVGKRPIVQRLTLASWSLRHRLLAFAALCFAGVALSLGAFRLYKSAADSKVTPGALVYLTPVKNQTGEKAFDNLTELIQAGLTQSAQINLLDQSQVGDILQLMTKPPDTVIDPPIAREIAMRAGASRLVFATVAGSAGSYNLNIDIQQPDSTPRRYRNHWTRSFAWHTSGPAATSGAIPPDLLTAIRTSSNWIRLEAGESANDIAQLDTPPEDVTTGNWRALEEYTEAEHLTQEDRIGEAVHVLQGAVQDDPHFALAFARMGDLLLALHRDVEGFLAYDRALAASRQERLTRKEEDRLRGMRATDTADYNIAVDAFKDYSVYYKDDYLGWAYPTLPLHMLGRDKEAIENLQHAVQIAPERPFAPYALAKELILVDRKAEAGQWIDFLRKRGHTDLANEADAYLSLVGGQYKQAAQALQPLRKSSDSRRRSYFYQGLAVLAAETGHDREAIEWINRGLTEDEAQNNAAQRASKLLARAYIEMRDGTLDQCVEDVRSALRTNGSPRNVLAADTVLGLAFAKAPRHRAEPIRQALREIEHSQPSEGYGAIFNVVRLRTRGEVLLTRGNAVAALEAFQGAAAKNAPVESREYLARALLRFAAIQRERSEARALTVRAFDAYSFAALSPASVWSEMFDCLPGFYSDQLVAYLHLADELGVSSPEILQARARMASLRTDPVDPRSALHANDKTN